MNGDGVSDTPAHYGPTEDYVGSESCWTDYVLDTCEDVQGIDPGPDPTDNCTYSSAEKLLGSAWSIGGVT